MYFARILLFSWNQKFFDVQINFSCHFSFNWIFLNNQLYHQYLAFGWRSIGKSWCYSPKTLAVAVLGYDLIISSLYIMLQIAVLIVDTQGTGANTRPEKLATLIMYLSIEISTVQILNVWKYLTSENLALFQVGVLWKFISFFLVEQRIKQIKNRLIKKTTIWLWWWPNLI